MPLSQPPGRHVLLLTATISPKQNQPNLALFNPLDRLADYSEALGFYSSLLAQRVVHKIVFVENSGYDLQPLKALYPSIDIEWVSFYDLDYSGNYHRGYGEFRLIDNGMEQSIVLSTLSPADHVWKITGRYKIINLAKVIRFAPRKFDLYLDLRPDWAEMSLMAWSAVGHISALKGIWNLFATDKAPELILADQIHSGRIACNIQSQFHWPPFIVGRRGTDGGKFERRWPIRFWLHLVKHIAVLPFRSFIASRNVSSGST
jgi:hypothetical protein